MASEASKEDVLAAPYDLLLQRVEESIKLRNLLSELLFMVLYFVFFITFVVLQADTEGAFEVNLALQSAFRLQPFPGYAAEGMVFDSIETSEDWLSWFNNVALPNILESRYASTQGVSVAPTMRPTAMMTNAPNLGDTEGTFSPSDTFSPSSSPVARALTGNRTQAIFALLWQKRVRNETNSGCVNAPAFIWNSLTMLNAPPGQPAIPSNANPNRVCYPAYSAGSEATSPLRFANMFTYYSQSPINDPGLNGVLQLFYPANGYYSAPINALFALSWPQYQNVFIDPATRLLAVTNVVFNPTYRVWSVIALYTEVMEDGTMFPSANTITSSIMYCSSTVLGCTDNPAELVLASIVGVFIILHFIFILVFRRLYALYVIVFHSGRKSLLQVLVAWMWDLINVQSLLDIAQAALGLISLTYISNTYWSLSRYNRLVQIDLGAITMDDAAAVVSYLANYNYMQQIFGVQIVLFNIQVFKYFPAMPCCSLVRMGWANVYLDVIKVFLMYWVLIFVFGLVGMLVFGEYILNLAAYATALNASIRMILGETNFDLLRVVSPQFVWVYLLIFLVCFVYILQALFLSVVIEGFRLAFQSYEAQTRTDWLDLFRKTLWSDSRKSREYASRLRAWKELRVNKGFDVMTRAQVKAALRGQAYNRMEVTEQMVDEVFLLVRAHELRKVESESTTENQDPSSELLNSIYANENSALMPQLLKTMFEIKANERGLMKEMGVIMRQLRKTRDDASDALRAADRASAIFVKEE